ncbi:MAG TPA: nuclear transport factor 2 family protein [Acidimicrobiales bacterium]|nr:nuclear transport factor 2 family protein [Acidimicrobiales bacterium]
MAKRRRLGPSDPMAVVSRFLDAANHHDADTIYATVHPDFESFQPLHPGRNFRGPGQLVSNWKAIFEAEPGFRLTVLRASTTGNTVWVELHGAGDSAEAAGIFIVGVENGRIRWVRVYSDLVEPLPEPVEEPPPAVDAAAPPTVEVTVDGAEPEGRQLEAEPEPAAGPEPVEVPLPSPAGEGGEDGPEAGTGWVETLVGRTGPVPIIAIPDDGAQIDEAQIDEAPIDSISEIDAHTEPDADTGTDSVSGPDTDVGSWSVAEEEPDAEAELPPLDLSGLENEPEGEPDEDISPSDETAGDGRQPVRSRWRKAFKRS